MGSWMTGSDLYRENEWMNNARYIAYKILYKILFEGAYSNIEINKTFRKKQLDNRDRGFITELVYGVLEKKIYFEYIISKFSKMPIKKLSREVYLILLMGLYQIRYMDSVTDFAAVDESVKLCKTIFPKGSGFINGMLRNVLRNKGVFEIHEDGSPENMSIRYSISYDIVILLVEQYGACETERILKALSEKPRMFLRINQLKTDIKNVREDLYLEGIEAEDVFGEPLALQVRGFKNIENSNAYQKGLFTVQDHSSMMVVRMLEPKKNEKILDTCSCPGGKATFIAELMENKGSILAQDISGNKLELVDKNCKRLGINIVQTKVHDATLLDRSLIEKFDRVLIDAPCSGLGIIRKKPEIRYKTKKQIEDLYNIQSKILSNGAEYLKKGGILVYSTCTINKKENEDQIRRFLKTNRFELIEEKALIFEEGDSDGFYIAKLIKTENE